MNDPLCHLLKLAPGIIYNDSGFISEYVDSSDGLRLLNQHVSPLEVGKWVQVRRGIYKGDVGYVTSTESERVQLLLIPRLSQPQAKGNLSHSRSAPALFDCETVQQLHNIKPLRIQENIYSFRGDTFEHGLILKSYHSDLISTTVSCMPFESFCHFLESRHPTLMASRSSFLKPSEWHFAEGDEVHYDYVTYPTSHKSGVISALRSDAVELSTDEGIVCVSWLDIYKIIRQGDFVEVTGGVYLGRTGWVNEILERSIRIGDNYHHALSANIITIQDNQKQVSNRIEVFPIPFEYIFFTHIPLRYLTCP